jgi:hypothetical protein
MIYWFWTLFVSAIILWYILVTTLVGVKGALDIKKIFEQMKNNKD